MSTQTSPAARRSVLSTLLVRLLQVLGLTIRRSVPLQTLPAKTRSRRAFAFETLEPRLMMSADLTGDLAGVALPAHVLPSDHLSIPVVIHNNGADASSLTPVVRLYASASGHVDADSIILGESAVKNSAIKAGKTATVNVAIDASLIDAPGSYSLIAVVDATNKVRESNEGNNTVVAANPLHIDWSFGSVAGHTNTDSITLTDPTGTQVTFKLSGAGRGDVTLDGNAFDVHLTGTNANSKLSITTAGGGCVATIDDLLVDGSLNAIQAANANLTGLLSLGGTVRSIELGDIGQDAGISVAGSATSIKLVAGRVTGADIVSASAFDSISIGDWRAAGSDAGSIRATSIGDLEIDGAFAGNLTLTGATSGNTLGSAEIAGRVSSALWNIHGSAGSIEAGSTDVNWHGAFSGSVQKFETDGDMRGTLSAHDIGTLHVGGDMIGARVLAGADLGSDGLAGGTGSAADRFNQTVMTQLRVDHSIRDSTIMVGVNPVDGVYGNGNDVFVGGQASRLQSLIVEGKLLGATDVFAGAFAQKVKINGANVNSSSVVQLHTTFPDTTGPQLSTGLAGDTGASASDRITSNPTIAGTAKDVGGIATLTGSLDGSTFKNIKAFLHADGSFSLDAAALSALSGLPLADGAHALVVRATDAANNASTSTLSFTLDRSAPAVLAFGLDDASESGVSGDGLTNKIGVILSGVAEAGATVELLGTSIYDTTDSSGAFRFAGLSLDFEGANTFSVRATDLAGNSTVRSATVMRDATPPDLSVRLQNDTGASNSDAVTKDPTITAHVSDASSVVSLSYIIDGQFFNAFLPEPVTDLSFTLGADYLDSISGGHLADGSHIVRFMATDAAANSISWAVGFILDREAPTVPQFDLAAASDSGVPGDQHTTQSIVSLTGFADAGATLTIDGRNNVAVFDGNTFRFDGVALNEGVNALTVKSVDLAGNESIFQRLIFLDGGGSGPGDGSLPDLIVGNIESQAIGLDESGQTVLRVEWTTTNTGSAAAHGQSGFRVDTLYASMRDAKDFSDDDVFLGRWAIDGDLAPGAQQVVERDVILPFFVPAGYHLYVVTDDGNQVFEKTAGEYNNTTIDYVPSGVAPPDIGPSDSHLALDGTATGGTIDAPGETDVYTFNLNHESRIYFDSLSANPDVKWELQDAGGHVLFARSFDTSDAFGMGATNPLLDLQAGSYKFVVSGDFANGADSYAFRLMDVDAVAATTHQDHPLILDGGPLLGQHMDRGDQTDVYQFQATAGTHYVVGGLNDRAIEDDMVFRLLDPQGQQVWTGTHSPSDEAAFAETGTYTLLVEGNVQHTEGFDYNVYVFTPQDRHFDLAMGQPVHAFIDGPGQVNTYSFALTSQSALFFDGSQNANGPYFDWALDGQGVHFAGNTVQDSQGLMNLDAGSYMLTVHGEGNAAGWYDFRMIDVSHDLAPTISTDVPVSGVIYPGFDAVLYRFDALAGEHLSIAMDTNDPDWISYDPARWLLVDTQGHVAFSGAGDQTFDFDADGSGSYALLIEGRQYNWAEIDYTLTVGTSQAAGAPVFGLAPDSDTGVAGDHHTTLPIVSLSGVASANALVTLAGTPFVTVADAAGAFRFDGVSLTPGDNALTVLSTDPAGHQNAFMRIIHLDGHDPGGGTGSGQPLPDLVVTDIESQVTGQTEFGDTFLHVEATVANEGAAAAHGQWGYRVDSLYASMSDTTTFNFDDIYLGNVIINSDLAAGSDQVIEFDVMLPSWVPQGYRLYVLVDDGNQVYEKTAGEYNNTTMDYVATGFAPPDITNTAAELLLDGTAVAGSIDAPGETHVYTFELGHESKILFDSLSAHSDMKWELQRADGQFLFGQTFDKSDAFGMGDINALQNLQAGSYKIVVSDTLALGTGSYAFRLLDVNQVAAGTHQDHPLILDGGALLAQHMDRGDQTDVYQFQAMAGQQYVVGGPSDNTIEHGFMFRLFDPEGNQVWHSDTSPSDVHAFAETGTYTLVVEGNVQHTDPADYQVYVFTPQDRHYDLASTGQQVSGFIDAPGQVNTYTFSLNDTSSLFIDGVFGSNGAAFDWSIDGPNGAHFFGNTSFDSALMDVGAGDYTISIKGDGNASGWYNFRLMDVLHDAAPTMTVDSDWHGAYYPGFDSALIRFDAQAGQALAINLTTSDPDWISYDPIHWQLIDPQGHFVTEGPTGVSTNFTADESGTWAVLLMGRQYNWTGVEYLLQVNSQMHA